jgi:pilus assembly protein CpaB
MARKSGAGGIIALALVLGVVTAVLLGSYLRKQEQGKKEHWQQVVVAAQDIPARTKITRDMVRAEHFPKDLIAEHVFTKPEEVVDRITKDAVKSKEQIRANTLLEPGQSVTLALKVREGMRAVAIGGDEVRFVGTSVQPGDRVDIIATYQDPRTRQELTKMILQNVMVLAVNRGKTDADGKEGANSSMTLEVTPEQSELVTAAERSGTLRVSLRSVRDSNVVDTGGVDARDFAGAKRPPETTAQADRTAIIFVPPSSGGRAARPEITIIKGSEEKTVSP